MKIAFFHELSDYSGAKRVVEEYGKILSRNNNVDLYYVAEKEDSQMKKTFNSVLFYKFEEKKWKGDNWRIKFYKDTIEFIKLYNLHKRVARQINIINYDFIFINPSKFTQAPFILRSLKAKKVYYCQEPLRIIYDEKVSKLGNLSILKKVYEGINRTKRKYIDLSNINKSDLILCNSEFSKNNIKNAYNLKAFVCYLGVNEKIFKSYNINKETDVLFIGDKSAIEGYDLLEKTLKLFRNNPKIKLIVEDRKLKDEQLVKEYNKTKLTLVLSRNEPFGLIPVESMACGVPVIALNEGGLKESVINGETGYLVSPEEKEIKEKIDLLLNNEQLRKKMSKRARDVVLNRFSWEKSVKNFLHIVKNNL